MNQQISAAPTPPDDAYIRMIGVGLDRAVIKTQQPENQASTDIAQARYIIFSDLHKGARNGADDFRFAERAYNAALAYYFEMGYTLVVLGDVEDLWEERASDVLKAYPHTIELEAQFHQVGRYWRFWGNHDDDWSCANAVKKHLAPLYSRRPLNVRECLSLRVTDGAQQLGTLLLLHGHQGTLESDYLAGPSRLLVRYVWRNFQRLTKVSRNTPAKSWDLREKHNQALYAWAAKRSKLILVAGHTHRPVFKSISHPAKIRDDLKDARKEYERTCTAAAEQRVAELAAELEWVLTQQRQPPGPEGVQPMIKPCYFNTGCCCFLDGDITGLEIADGEFRLVRWPDDSGAPNRQLLDPCKAKITEVFAAC